MSDEPETLNPNWEPFLLLPPEDRPEPPRSIHSREGVGDRMRTAAFAELQAREVFLWAAEHFHDAPDGLRQAWHEFSTIEQRHYDWITARMAELGIDFRERAVSDFLWRSSVACKTARAFAFFIAEAEERGRKAGIRFFETLKASDPKTAEIFRKIAEEEVSHVELPGRFFENPTPLRPAPSRSA